MSGPDRAADAQRWLRFADEDLQIARTLLAQHQPPRAVCFHAQQAAEKAIKAVLVLLNIKFPRTHDLELLQLLVPEDSLTKTAPDLPELSDWAVQSRYPTDAPEPALADAQRAIALAQDVLRRAHQDFTAKLPRSPSMANITAQMVNELRSKTGQGMMECKKALTETGGDVEKAIEYFRKKGVKTSIMERAANEGRVHVAASPDRKTAVAVVVNTNTDFTAKSEVVSNLLKVAAERLLKNPDANVAEDPAVKDQLVGAAQQTGENVQIGKTAAVRAPDGGVVGTYVYVINHKTAVLMAFKGNPSEETIKNMGGHIAFAKPLGLTRSEIPQDLVAKEREIAVEQAKATGKPQQIAEKIAEGKLNAFFAERVLLDQEFFNSQLFKGTVSQYLKQNNATLEKYERIEVGQQ